MTDANHWSERFPGSAAAEWIRNWLSERLEEVTDDRIREARNALEYRGWRRNHDLAGVPEQVYESVERGVAIAWDALREPHVQKDAAIKALRMTLEDVAGP